MCCCVAMRSVSTTVAYGLFDNLGLTLQQFHFYLLFFIFEDLTCFLYMHRYVHGVDYLGKYFSHTTLEDDRRPRHG